MTRAVERHNSFQFTILIMIAAPRSRNLEKVSESAVSTSSEGWYPHPFPSNVANYCLTRWGEDGDGSPKQRIESIKNCT